MAITKEEIFKFMSKEIYATVVTNGKSGMNSRTMTFGYVPADKVFLLTHKGTTKLDDINYSTKGLVHISSIEENIILSIDISIEGTFEFIEYPDPLFNLGLEALAKKNAQIKDILSEETSRRDYTMMLFNIKHLKAWNYSQVLSGEPKTILI